MWILIDILKYSFSSLIWGILIAIICMVLFVFLIKGWYKDATFSPVSYIIGAILFVFLSIQCILIVGSLKILYSADYYETEIASIVDSVYDVTDKVTNEQTDKVVQTVIDEFPLLHNFIGDGDSSDITAKELPHALADELRSFMRWYIFRRILWCLGFVIVGAICVIMTQSKSYTPLQRSERGERQRVQTERRRVSRRPRR